MSFQRTNSGITNYYRFYNSELVIYTEGGTIRTRKNESDTIEYSTNSIDIKFWSGVLAIHGFTEKIKFKALGSKTASNDICRKIISGSVANVAVARDRDLDNHMNSTFTSPFILYTKGYSWENDVYSEELTLKQLESLIHEPTMPQGITDYVKSTYKTFRIFGRHLGKLELIFRLNGIQFITDLNAEQLFQKGLANLNKYEIKKIISEKKKILPRPAKLIRKSIICPLTDNYGKLIEALSLRTIQTTNKRFKLNYNLPNKIIQSTMLERYINNLRNNKDPHYKRIAISLKKAIQGVQKTRNPE